MVSEIVRLRLHRLGRRKILNTTFAHIQSHSIRPVHVAEYNGVTSCPHTELMQTEMHHVRTLKIMLRVYVQELKDKLQMDAGKLDCLFPQLENLLELHTHFLSRLKERQRENFVSPNDRNYAINRLADILISQVGRRYAGTGLSCFRHMTEL